MPWLKLDHTYLDNPRLGALPEHIQLRFFKLYMLAHQCQADGVITHSHEEIAWKLHISPADLDATYEALARANLFRNNGRGPEIPTFLDEQRTNLQRQEDAERQRKHRAKDVTPLSQPCHAIESESESESESDKDIESERDSSKKSVSQSQSQSPATRPEIAKATDRILHQSKTDLFVLLQIPEKYKSLVTDTAIFSVDLMAEYARCRSDPKRFHKPASCTGMNLLKHQYPEARWYKPSQWRHLSDLGLDIEDMVARSYSFEAEENEISSNK